MKIGMLFAGQGAQYPGMGKSLYDSSQKAKNIFDLAGDEIKEWCFNGTKEQLKQTNITQPCVYTVSMAAYEAFKEALTKLDKELQEKLTLEDMAGFSLGEYTALTAAGVIADFAQGVDVVRKRGQWMNEAGQDANGESIGGMAAGVGERKKILACVEEAREDGTLEGVNFNSPQQTVVAGDKAALERFKLKAKEMGGIKAVPLSVSAAFHSPMMAPMTDKLKELLLSIDLRVPQAKLYSNVTGEDIMTGSTGEEQEWLAERMAQQAKSPVYWQETIEHMVEGGVDVFIEVGPGTTLSGLVKKINGELPVLHIDDMDSLQETVEKLKEMIS